MLPGETGAAGSSGSASGFAVGVGAGAAVRSRVGGGKVVGWRLFVTVMVCLAWHRMCLGCGFDCRICAGTAKEILQANAPAKCSGDELQVESSRCRQLRDARSNARFSALLTSGFRCARNLSAREFR
jgi:hypothetical protein